MGYGAAIWAVLFVVISALVGFGVYGNSITKGIVVIGAGALAYWLAMRTDARDWGKAIIMGVSWVIISMVLDYLISTRFAPSLFSSRALWVGYALVLIGALAGSMWGKKPSLSSAMPM